MTPHRGLCTALVLAWLALGSAAAASAQEPAEPAPPTEPTPTEPAPAEPVEPTAEDDPVSTEEGSAPTEATPTEPTPAEPTPAEPTEPDEPVKKKKPEAPIVPELAPAKHYELAQRALENGDHDTAMYHYERAVAGQPDDLRWGAEYRQVAIAAEAYDRSIDFWKQIAEQHPDLANVRMNLGYAHVDKIPAEGAITQVILANTALTHFSKALELEETWLGYYTRGNSYMYWPAIFGRTSLGIADLEKAIAMADGEPRHLYQGRAWAALGDGYWRLDDREKMREVWQQGLELYPGLPELEERMAREGDELDEYLDGIFLTSRRVETHLREVFEAEKSEEGAP